MTSNFFEQYAMLESKSDLLCVVIELYNWLWLLKFNNMLDI